jgi:hypothetical protein
MPVRTKEKGVESARSIGHPLASVGTLVLGLRCSWCVGITADASVTVAAIALSIAVCPGAISAAEQQLNPGPPSTPRWSLGKRAGEARRHMLRQHNSRFG